MGDVLTGLVRYLHIFSAVMWIGGAFLWGMLIAPNVAQRVAPPARGPFMSVMVPRFSNYMTIAGAITLLSGLGLMATIWSGAMGDMPVGYSSAMGVGLLAAIVLMVVGLWVIKPKAMRMISLMEKAQGPPPAEALALQKQLISATMINILVGAIALGSMVWAVNVFR